MPVPKKDVVTWFLEMIDIRSDGECWLWKGKHKGSGGYATFVHCGEWFRAHRFSYELFVGPIPEGMCVLHKCDVRHCVNSGHLFVGSKADNTADMLKKGRHSHGNQHGLLTCGEKNSSVRLTAEEVIGIRKRKEAGETMEDIAKHFGITPQNVWRIVHRQTWRHV